MELSTVLIATLLWDVYGVEGVKGQVERLKQELEKQRWKRKKMWEQSGSMKLMEGSESDERAVQKT